MRAVVLKSYGGPEVLEVREVPDPEPGPEDVLVDVVSTAVNRAEVLQRQGRYPQPGPPTDHEIPGLEFAGRVAACGPRVTAWRPGDEVMGIVSGGGYAERVVIHERQAIPVPAAVGVRDAGAIPEVWITAFDALVLQGGLRPGGVALVHAGGSGVGTAAIQLTRWIGATAIATASGPKGPACVALGARRAVDYREEDFVAVVAEETGGRGADVVLDVVGGDYLDRNLQATAERGCVVQVGTMGEARASLNLGRLMTRRISVVGTVLRARPIEEKIAVSRRFAAEVLPAFERRDLRPVIDSRYPLEVVGEAHRRMEANANVGKIAIDVAG